LALTLIGHPTSLSLPLSLPRLDTTRAFSSTLQACHIAEKDVQLLKKDMICHHAKFNPPCVNTAAFSPFEASRCSCSHDLQALDDQATNEASSCCAHPPFSRISHSFRLTPDYAYVERQERLSVIIRLFPQPCHSSPVTCPGLPHLLLFYHKNLPYINWESP
jgi:hypothetical protein